MIVTGGSNGMGKYMAQKFATEGANVVITGRNAERLAAAKKRNCSRGWTGSYYTMDVRNPDDVDRMVKETDEQFGTIDFLVNNAAGNFITHAEKLFI